MTVMAHQKTTAGGAQFRWFRPCPNCSIPMVLVLNSGGIAPSVTAQLPWFSTHAAACVQKGENGRPVFEFTATEAEKVFSIPRPTFSKAIKSLIKIGFVEIAQHGGIRDGKGIPALYRLTDRWKAWKASPRDNTNILKARKARKKHGDVARDIETFICL